jgi:Protein of unknown function (DUF692)
MLSKRMRFASRSRLRTRPSASPSYSCWNLKSGKPWSLFGQKFSDIVRRHRVLHGPDPFAGVHVSRAAVIVRLKQVSLNLMLRLLEAYVERGSMPERVAELIADSAGPLRSCAATMLELEGKPAAHPKERTAPPPRKRLDKMARLVERIPPESWSEHLAFVRAGGVQIGHLATPPRASSTIDATAANLDAARAAVGSLPLVENVATLIDPPASDRDEPAWLTGTLAASGAGMLLDLCI